MRRMFLAVAAALVLSANGALAQGAGNTGYDLDDFELRSGQDLVDICTLSETHADYHVARAFCLGFMEGAGQLHNALASGPGFDRYFCVPEGTTLDQVVEVYASFASNNPQHMSEKAIDSLFRAVAAQWPCR